MCYNHFMKFKFFEVVKKIDYVLVFLASLFIALSMIYFFLAEIVNVRARVKRPQVDVVSAESGETVENKETTDYIGKFKDVFVFALKSSAIRTQDASSIIEESDDMNYASENLVSGKSKGTQSDTFVNMIFVHDATGEETKLFPRNVFIYRHCFEHYEYNEISRKNESVFHKNVYAVIENDANKDGKLNTDDFVCLFVSDYDGKNLKKLAGNICFARLEKDNLIFADYKDGEKTYFSYNADKDTLKKIKTTNEAVSGKMINLW